MPGLEQLLLDIKTINLDAVNMNHTISVKENSKTITIFKKKKN